MLVDSQRWNVVVREAQSKGRCRWIHAGPGAIGVAILLVLASAAEAVEIGVTAKWRAKAQIYRRFAAQAERTGFICDFSDAAAQAMFERETYGRGEVKRDNGFAIGKRWLDVQIASWVDDILHDPSLVTWAEIDDDLKYQVTRAVKSKCKTRAA